VPQSPNAGSAIGGDLVSQRQQVIAAAGTAVLVAIATVVYFVLPLTRKLHTGSWLALFLGGIGVLAILILLSIRRLLRQGEQARVRALVFLLSIALLFFSYADDSLAQTPGEFVDLHTKTDALYFGLSTLATVGFGDVHAAGQLARQALIVQMLFNLIFIGAAVAIVSGRVRQRANERLRGGPAGSSPKATGTQDSGG